MKRKVKNQRYQIAALYEKVKGGRDESGDYESGGEGAYNRGHPVLIRQNKKKKKVKFS